MLTSRNTSALSSGETEQQHAGCGLLRVSDLDYALPERLIATRPIAGARDAARMMVLSRSDPGRLEHLNVRDLPALLHKGDALVFNRSAVARARLKGVRAKTGGSVEGLFLSTRDDASSWRVLLKSNGRLRPGDRIALVGPCSESANVTLELRERDGAEWQVDVKPGPASVEEAIALLERIGHTPLPPYILRARGKRCDISDELDRAWYETVYADTAPAMRQSVAAPTAGLHFTPEILAELDERGMRRLHVALHVGAGTFQPVTAEVLSQHRMHSEQYEVPRETLEGLANADRVIAVGTTTVRTLESLPVEVVKGPIAGSTNLLIAPGYRFRSVDGMLTNFHLPRSTLLALVAAMLGLERVKEAYRVAIEREYRFYSYGDCMLILP